MKSYILYTLFSLHWNSTPFPLILCFSSFLFSHLISSSLFLFSFSLSVFASFLFLLSSLLLHAPFIYTPILFLLLYLYFFWSSSFLFLSLLVLHSSSRLLSSGELVLYVVCVYWFVFLWPWIIHMGDREFSQSLWCNHFSFSTGSTGSRMLMAGETLRVRIWSVWCF